MKPLMLLFLASASAVAAPAAKDVLTFVTPSGSRSYTLAQLKGKLKVETVEVEDPIYRKKKTYDGFALGAVLDLLGPQPGGIDDVLFTASDGYTPGISLEKARAKEGFVVFREHGSSRRFEPMPDGKTTIDPSPFYVVWREGAGEEYPRPYQLVRIELVSYAAKFPKIYPKDVKADSTAMKGFAVFRQQCLRCHSINLEGGTIGPELNLPKNITTYWSSRETIEKFIHKVSDFRAKSKMPDFDKDLSAEDVSAVVDYLTLMKDQQR